MARTLLLTAMAMLAFAANSILCRLALRETRIDPATFTAIRLGSGAAVLCALALLRKGAGLGGSWGSGLALFAYAAAFSFAYTGLPAATGALLLFGAVQVVMGGYGLSRGERFGIAQLAGLGLATAGLMGLLWPGLAAPPAGSAALMLVAGASWGIYSLRGRGPGDATAATAGNFLRASPMALLLLPFAGHRGIDARGAALAIASGALASGLGYAIWYSALPRLRATTAATMQLSVPVLAALAGIVVLGEPLSLRLVLASIAVLGGVALTIAASGRA